MSFSVSAILYLEINEYVYQFPFVAFGSFSLLCSLTHSQKDSVVLEIELSPDSIDGEPIMTDVFGWVFDRW